MKGACHPATPSPAPNPDLSGRHVLAWHMRAQPGASSSLERHGCNIEQPGSRPSACVMQLQPGIGQGDSCEAEAGGY